MGGDTTTNDVCQLQVMQQKMAHFSRPGSAYVINVNTTGANNQGNKVPSSYSVTLLVKCS